MSEENVVEKTTKTVLSSSNLITAVIALFGSLLVLGIFCVGSANSRAGIVLHDGWGAAGQVLNDIYCGDTLPCTGMGESLKAYWDGTKIGKAWASEEPSTDELPQVEIPASEESSVDVPPPAMDVPPPEPQGPPQALIDAVNAEIVFWQANHVAPNMKTIAMQFPEATTYGPYIALKTEVDTLTGVVNALGDAQKALTSGTADYEKWVEKVGNYIAACNAYSTATSGSGFDLFKAEGDTCRQNSDWFLLFSTAYADALKTPEDFAEIVATSWRGTTWTITVWDDKMGIGAKHEATITGADPSWIKDLTITVPTSVIKELFDLKGEEVGQTITWP